MQRVLWGDLAWHPAAAAWQAVAPTAPTPECIEVLRGKNGVGVYRLVGVGPGGTTIIARRARFATAVAVRTLYEKMAPRLPIKTSRFIAFRRERPGFAWVFLQEVGRNGRGRANGR